MQLSERPKLKSTQRKIRVYVTKQPLKLIIELYSVINLGK